MGRWPVARAHLRRSVGPPRCSPNAETPLGPRVDAGSGVAHRQPRPQRWSKGGGGQGGWPDDDASPGPEPRGCARADPPAVTSRSALRGTGAALRRPTTPQPRITRGLPIDGKATLRQAWPQENLGPQGAFEVSMINVSCNSH